MLRDLVRLVGHNELPAVLGFAVLTVRNWQAGKFNPDTAGRRAVWLTWCLLLHPERIQTAFDLATWGRFRVERRPAPPEDWSI